MIYFVNKILLALHPTRPEPVSQTWLCATNFLWLPSTDTRPAPTCFISTFFLGCHLFFTKKKKNVSVFWFVFLLVRWELWICAGWKRSCRSSLPQTGRNKLPQDYTRFISDRWAGFFLRFLTFCIQLRSNCDWKKKEEDLKLNLCAIGDTAEYCKLTDSPVHFSNALSGVLFEFPLLSCPVIVLLVCSFVSSEQVIVVTKHSGVS